MHDILVLNLYKSNLQFTKVSDKHRSAICMKITKVELKEEIDGIQSFMLTGFGDIVILTGVNGSGKTRLLKVICQYIQNLENKDKLEISYIDGNRSEGTYCEANVLHIANYSHYDAVLQSPMGFPPYVIGKAKILLEECNYEETALNALLVIHDMAYGYSEEYRDGVEFKKFQKFAAEHFGIEVGKTDAGIQLFGQDVDGAKLSPGQQYLLRIAIACFFNKNRDDLLIVLDEPEVHLHPDALIKMFEQLKKHFKDRQFWISTHSIDLISYIVSTVERTTILSLEHGNVSLLESVPGGGIDNSIYFQQPHKLPDQYICVRFALKLMINQLSPKSVVVDYGAGNGRLLEQLAMDAPELIAEIQYYAFELSGDKDSTICRRVMRENGICEAHYFDNIKFMKSELRGKASHIFLVNVLHEVLPQEWEKIFLDISELLTEDGMMCIIERETLTAGQVMQGCGLGITANAVEKLFQVCEEKRYLKNEHIAGYLISKKAMENISDQNVKDAVEQIKSDSVSEIERLKSDGTTSDLKSTYDKGIRLAFWLNQYANASLIIENKN